MIDGGLILMLIGAATLLAGPAHAQIAWRRWARTAAIGETLRAAVPIANLDPHLDRLVADADAALARDALLTGVGGIVMIYDRA